jgi:hypothetical protein
VVFWYYDALAQMLAEAFVMRWRRTCRNASCCSCRPYAALLYTLATVLAQRGDVSTDTHTPSVFCLMYAQVWLGIGDALPEAVEQGKLPLLHWC